MASSGLVLSSPAPQAALRPLKQPLYDTMIYAQAGQAQLRFFSVPLGQPIVAAGANKTLADTNLEQAGQLGTPQEFDLHGFQFEVAALSGRVNRALAINNNDVLGIMQTGVFEFTFGANRPLLQVPLTEIPRGVGVTGMLGVDGFVAQTTREHLRCGTGDPNEYYNFTIEKKPIRLRSNETFGVNLLWPLGVVAISALIRIRVIMVGMTYSAM